MRPETGAACLTAHYLERMPAPLMTVDGFPVRVSVTGPEKGPFVVLLGSAENPPAAYDTLCQRLHTAAVRTVDETRYVHRHEQKRSPERQVALQG